MNTFLKEISDRGDELLRVYIVRKVLTLRSVGERGVLVEAITEMQRSLQTLKDVIASIKKAYKYPDFNIMPDLCH